MSALGHLADLATHFTDVRFTPNSGHQTVGQRCPLSAQEQTI